MSAPTCHWIGNRNDVAFRVHESGTGKTAVSFFYQNGLGVESSISGLSAEDCRAIAAMFTHEAERQEAGALYRTRRSDWAAGDVRELGVCDVGQTV